MMAALVAAQAAGAQTRLAANQAADQSEPMPPDQLGVVAGKQYQGDALGVTATAEGARLRCGFQKLEGCATPEGLWVESTQQGGGDRLRLTATAVGREVLESSECGPDVLGPLSVESGSLQSGKRTAAVHDAVALGLTAFLFG
jgi:hypothetical protein